MAETFRSGSYTGDGAAQNIELGWIPDVVEVDNITDGDEEWKSYLGVMTAAHALKIASDGTKTRITSNGISQYAGSSTPGSEKRKGFTIGTALSESGKTFGWRAFRRSQD